MSAKMWTAIGCLVGAVICGVLTLFVGAQTVVPMAASGAQVSGSGWAALLTSILGTGGLSVGSIIAFILSFTGKSTGSTGGVGDFVELASAFAAFMADKKNRATQRRFVFALTDVTDLIPGLETSHEAGVIVIKYDGFADPPPAAKVPV